MKRALFGRKICNLEELKELTQQAIKDGKKGQPYIITREVILKNDDFMDFAKDFLKDQIWINLEDGGINEKGEIKCVRVKNADTGKKILINTEGYDYPRYTALELSSNKEPGSLF